jgi:hypothetical protein
MPQTITVPGVGDLQFPDGMSDTDMAAAIQRNYPQIHGAQSQQAPSFVDSALNTLKNAGAGYLNFVDDSATHPVGELEKAAHLASGAIGGLGGGLAYLGKLATTGGDTTAAKAAQEATQAALTYQPHTDAGKRLAGAIDNAMGVVPKAANAAGSFVANASGSPALGAAINTGIQAAPMLLGVRRGLGSAAETADAGAADAATTSAPKVPTTPAELAQQSLDNGTAVGYQLPPNLDPNASTLSRVIQSIAGKANAEQRIAVPNQGVTNALAARAVGQNPASLITRQSLQQVRQAAIDQGYKPIEELSGPIQADAQFMRNQAAIRAAHGDELSGNPDVTASANILLGLKKGPSAGVDPLTLQQRTALPTFDPAQITDQISTLRSRAQDAFAAGRGSAGTAFRSQAGELEALLDRHLQDLGDDVPKSVLNNYRAARQLIAKTHTIEDALNPSTGNVDAVGLGKALKNGIPLTEDLKTIADFANAAPSAAAVPKGAPLPSSAATHLAGAALAHSTGGASLALIPAARLFASRWLMKRNANPALLQPGSNGAFGQTALDAIYGNAAAFAKLAGPSSAGALLSTIPDHSPLPPPQP